MFQVSVFQTWTFEFEEKTEEAPFPLWTRRPIPQISGIRASGPSSGRVPPAVFAGLAARSLLVLTPARLFHHPLRNLCGAAAPFSTLRQKMKSEPRGLGYIY